MSAAPPSVFYLERERSTDPPSPLLPSADLPPSPYGPRDPRDLWAPRVSRQAIDGSMTSLALGPGEEDWDAMALMVQRASFSPDGTVLVWTPGRTVRVLDVVHGRELARVGGDASSFANATIEWSPDGRFVVVREPDGAPVVLRAPRWDAVPLPDLRSVRAARVGVDGNGDAHLVIATTSELVTVDLDEGDASSVAMSGVTGASMVLDGAVALEREGDAAAPTGLVEIRAVSGGELLRSVHGRLVSARGGSLWVRRGETLWLAPTGAEGATPRDLGAAPDPSSVIFASDAVAAWVDPTLARLVLVRVRDGARLSVAFVAAPDGDSSPVVLDEHEGAAGPSAPDSRAPGAPGGATTVGAVPRRGPVDLAAWIDG